MYKLHGSVTQGILVSAWEKITIPLDEAHEILTAFGIGPSFRDYQRWHREDWKALDHSAGATMELLFA
jgi:hypothetical protein